MGKECIKARRQIRKFFQSTEQEIKDNIQKEFFLHTRGKQGEKITIKCESCWKYYSEMFDKKKETEAWSKGMGSML